MATHSNVYNDRIFDKNIFLKNILDKLSYDHVPNTKNSSRYIVIHDTRHNSNIKRSRNLFGRLAIIIWWRGTRKVAELSENIDSSPEHTHDRP
jgi:hypothetical protein